VTGHLDTAASFDRIVVIFNPQSTGDGPQLAEELRTDLTERLPRIRASNLLVWGERDEDTPLWMAKRMEELIPDVGLVVLEGAGHYSYADSPGQFRAVARRFLIEQPREAAKQ